MNLGPGDLKYQKDDSDNDNKLSVFYHAYNP